MQIQLYLNRIGYTQAPQPNPDTLRGMHRAHMLTVPFENLDIVPLSRPIRLDEKSLWDKLVINQRGGFCYELNGMFAWLLKEIGFEVTYLNARVYNDDGTLGIDFDHLTLLVQIPDESERYLADVGFGDSFLDPLRFEVNKEQPQGLRAYKLEEVENGYTVWQRDYEGDWGRQYHFDLTPRNFPTDYEAACLYQQTSPESSFTHAGVISMATPDGRITLEKSKFIVTKNGKREEHPVSKGEYPALLKRYFGIVL